MALQLSILRAEHPRCNTCDHWMGLNGDDGQCEAAEFPGFGIKLDPMSMSADDSSGAVRTNSDFYCPQHSDL